MFWSLLFLRSLRTSNSLSVHPCIHSNLKWCLGQRCNSITVAVYSLNFYCFCLCIIFLNRNCEIPVSVYPPVFVFIRMFIYIRIKFCIFILDYSFLCQNQISSPCSLHPFLALIAILPVVPACVFRIPFLSPADFSSIFSSFLFFVCCVFSC